MEYAGLGASDPLSALIEPKRDIGARFQLERFTVSNIAFFPLVLRGLLTLRTISSEVTPALA